MMVGLIVLIVILIFLYLKLKGNMQLHKKLAEKNYLNYCVCRNWLATNNLNRPVCNYFNKLGYKKIAIYGLGEIGNLLQEEIQKNNIEISYAIDQNAENISSSIPIILPNSDDYNEVDAVIVTSIFEYQSIKSLLETKVKCPIISIEEVILEA